MISDKCVFQSTRNASITKGGEPYGLPRRRWGTRHVLGKTGAWLSRGPVRQAMRSRYCIPVCSLMYTYVYVDMYHYKLMSYIYTPYNMTHIYIRPGHGIWNLSQLESGPYSSLSTSSQTPNQSPNWALEPWFSAWEMVMAGSGTLFLHISASEFQLL